jgi:hypothetical protein
MADQVLKTVRITDNIKVEVLQQGKKRKYVIFYDGNNDYITGRRSGYDDTDKNNNTKSEKYDVAMSDDDVIEMALKAYNGRFGTPQKKFYITQKTYSDPAPARTYGNGDKSPYYINNGCAINIQWIGRIPNPEFNPGTYSNLSRAAAAGGKDGKPRYLENSTITSTTDNSENKDNFPKSSWSVSPPITDGLSGINLKEVPTDYRDTSSLQNKIVTVTLPKGFTENDGKGYLVWTEGGLQYDSKSIPEDTPFRRTVDIEGVPVDIGGSKPKNQIVYFDGGKSDQHVLEQVINDFISKITSLHGIFRYDLKLCAPDNETCSLIPYKSPLEPPFKANDLQTPPGPTPSNTKIKFTIDGLPTEIIIKAKEDLDTFTIWTGPIPKINNGSGNIDDFEDGEGDEYTETNFEGDGENIVTQEELKVEIKAAIEDAKSVVDDASTSNNGLTVKGLAPNTPLPANAAIPAGFNGVPLHTQYDPRWANSPYNTGGRCASKTVSSSGCGPSAVSMVINFWATKGKCNPVTPAVVAKFFAENGAFVCNGGSSLWTLNKDKFKNTFGITMKVGVTEAQIMAALRKGYPCVMSGASYRGYNFKGERIGERYNKGHVVCLTGIDSQGRIRVNDSGSSPTLGRAITAFIEGKNPSGGVGEFRQTAILYPSNMSSPIA